MLPRRIRRLLRLDLRSEDDARRDVEEEMRHHLELRAEELMAQGMDAETAHAEARRRFARAERTVRELQSTARERNRHMHVRERWESVLQDVRYAANALRRDLLLTSFVVVTLALGIGMNVTSFSLMDRLLVRPPEHVTDADRLLRLYADVDQGTAGVRTSSWVPFGNYEGLRDGMRTFERVGAYRVADGLVGERLDAREMRVGQVLGDFFGTLGTRPLLGRFFAADEDAAVAGDLAVLSESLWRSAFAADPGIVGRTVFVRDAPHTVVGVAPAGFSGTEPRRVDVWVLASSATVRTMNWHVVGRLRPGATAAMASQDAAAVHRRTAENGPSWMREADLFAAPIRYADDGRESTEATMSRWLAIVSLIILLVAFANVVNLLLARLVRRRRELAIRLALGAGRGRVLRLVAIEGALLAAVAGIASLLVTRFAEPVVRRALFADEAGWTFSLLDTRVFLTLLGVVAATALVTGLVPALQVGDPRLATTLRQGTGGGSRIRSALTVAQAALSVVLLVGAGVFLRSMERVRAVDLGVDTDRVLTVSTTLQSGTVDRAERARRDIEVNRILAEAAARVPGVAAAGVAVGLPLDGGAFSAAVYTPAGDSIPALPFRGPYVSSIAGDYFAAVGTAILRGRAFTATDRADTEPVIIVGEAMAGMLWPGRDPLGECVHVGRPASPCARVVGVAADIHRTGLREEPSAQYYLPVDQQSMFGGATLVVRPVATGEVRWPVLQAALFDAHPAVRAVEIHTLAEALEGDVRPLRLGVVTFGLSGALALLVAMLGLYSIIAYMVAWRTRELGVRVALGATDAQITRLVVGGGAGLAAAGIAVGLVLAFAGGRWIQPHLFETSAFDPLVVASVAVVLLTVAAIAGWIPARRALRIRPTEALRAE